MVWTEYKRRTLDLQGGSSELARKVAGRKAILPEDLGRRLSRKIPWYVFISPIVLGFLLFGVFSIACLICLSLCRWDMLGPITFVGLRNYEALITNSVFHRAVLNTVWFSVMFIIPNAAISFLLATMVSQPIRGKVLFRAAFFVPVVTSITVVVLIWQWLLKPTSNGPVNFFLGLLHIPPQKWTASVGLALPSVMLMTLWTTVGYYMVIWLAGLQNIPREIVEAAMLDGASGWQILWRVTLPLLQPVMFFILMQSTLGCLQLFSEVYLFTGGGPVNATTTIVLHVWREAFIFKRFGYASSVSIILLIASLGISLLMRRNLESVEWA